MTALSQVSNDAESRFAQLLQPIRDLTKNWEVDIAYYLDEYLDELDKLTISFDGGATTMNFAEAALLIQGSVCVYSKKVEYLYALVYQIMDLLANKKKLQQQADKQGKDCDSILAQTVEDDFLSLDDNVELAKVADMTHLVDISRNVMETLRTPFADLTGSKADRSTTDGADDQLHDGLFYMYSGTTYCKGLSVSNILDIMPPSFNTSTQLTIPRNSTAGAHDNDRHGDTLAPVFAEANDMPDDNDDGGDLGDPFNAGDTESLHGVAEPATEDATLKHNRQALRRGTREKVVTLHAQQEEEEEFLDPYKPTTDLPRKKGCVWKLPARIKAKNGRKRPRASTHDRVSIGQFCQQEFTQKAADAEFLKATSYVQFAELFEVERTRRRDVVRNRGKASVVQETEDECNEVGTAPDVNDANDDNNDANDDVNDDDGGHDVAAGGGDWIQQLNSLHLQQEFPDVPARSSYEELVAMHTDEYFTAAHKFSESSELAQRIEEWEARILPRLREEEERPPFNIHQYGSYILDAFGEDRTVMSLPQIVGHKSTYEICRYFSAMLQLANAHNVEIISEDQSMDNVQLRLLSRRRHYEEIADYKAPSTNIAHYV